jgi:hypothetical protein
MVASDYDWTEQFRISSNGARQPAWECCDTSTVSILEKMNGVPPTAFGLELSSDVYSPGDTVSIRIAIPAPADVKLQVSRVE